MDVLCKLNKKSIVTLREPSLSPFLEIKDGAPGWGYVQMVPSIDINLHFTDDIHAITTCDNYIFHGNVLKV